MAETTLKIAFVGAGAIHFGGAEGPWDHASRLEKMDGIKVIFIADPDVKKAEEALKSRLAGQHREVYEDCRVIADFSRFLDEGGRVDAAFLGIPPRYRGSCEAGRDLEVRIVQAGVALFVEKPLSVVPPEEFVEYVKKIKEAQTQTNVPVSVGYMFRYHAAVLTMKALIREHGGPVMAFNGRYYVAYSELDHAFWWDTALGGGPIVEQATHFCDLARFLVGDIDLKSVYCTILKDTGDASSAGRLSRVPRHAGCEVGVPVERQVPRVSAASWRFQSGGLGTLMHAVALHGKKYESSIDILMDGLRLTLVEPYHPECCLLVRDGRTDSDDVMRYEYGDDDPYGRELATFVAAVRSGDVTGIASTYEDAAKTYEFSWAIRRAGEASV